MKLHALHKSVFLLLGTLCLAMSSVTAQIFSGKLTGTQEVPPVLTAAEGNITATLTGNTLTVTGTFDNLTSDFDPTVAGGSHIHIAYAGQNGGIQLNLDPTLNPNNRGGTFAAPNNTFTLTTTEVEALENRRMYVNIHTTGHRGGELRAQLLPTATEYYMSNIFGSNEVPPVLTDAHGSVMIEADATEIRVSGSFAGLSSKYTASHIHIAMAGNNGAVEFVLKPTLNTDSLGGVYEADSNTFFFQPSQAQALTERRMYVNIHSNNHPGGEIRGQVVTRAQAVFRVHLSGATEIPIAPSMGHGGIVAELDGQQLIVSGSFAEMTSDYTASHIHTGMAGEAGTVRIPLMAQSGANSNSGEYLPASNTYPVTQAFMDTLFMRGFYLNIHSNKYGAGELRGQLLPESNNYLNAVISGMNEVPMVVTRGQGGVSLELHDTTLVISGSFSGLSSAYTASHIHTALAGANGSITFALKSNLAGNSLSGHYHPDSNRFQLTRAQAEMLKDRMMYINIHSQMNPSGEMRGQVLPAATFYFYIGLAPFNEPGIVHTRAKGMMVGEINGNMLTLSGTFSDLSSDFAANVAGGSHIHGAIAGRSGGIKTGLNVELAGNNRSGEYMADSNMYTLSQGYKDSIFNRMTYVNIHSANYTGGELRGQVLPIANMYFHALLTGGSEVPPVNTGAEGRVIAELRNNMLIVTGSFSGLMSDFDTAIAGGSHIHKAALAGMNGGILQSLKANSASDLRSATYMADSNMISLSSAMMDTLMMRMMYVNVHSKDHSSGEIRGQLLPNAQHYFTATLDGLNEIPSATTTASGAAVMELRGQMLSLSGSFQGLASNFNANVAGGSHLHKGGPAMNGPIAQGLNVDLASGNRAGTWRADSNMFNLSLGLMDSLFGEMMYVNVHSVQMPGGELRGEVLPAANHFPDSAMILNPAPGSSATVSGTATQLLPVNWNNVQDPDGNEVVYIWELAADPAFSTVLLRMNTGTDTVINFTYAEIDTLLAQTGITLGNSFTYYHRVYASDGSLHSTGKAATVTLTRGTVGDFSANLLGVNEVQPVQSTGKGTVIITRIGTDSISVGGSFSNLESAVDTSIQGGAHLHLGTAGTNGAIVFPLKFQITGNQKGGQFMNNRFMLTPAQSTSLDNGEFYVNVHTNNFSSGEIRGQVLPISNAAPPAPALTAPADNSTVVIDNSTSNFTARWGAVTDPDGDKVMYIWQASATSDFSKLLINRNVNTAVQYSASYEFIDSLLTEAGVLVGQKITIYHRAIASDGSLNNPSATRIVFLQKGNVGVKENKTSQVQVTAYPNPFAGTTQFDLTLDQPAKVSIEILNAIGQRVQSVESGNLPSGENTITLDAAGLAAGIYTYRVIVSNGNDIKLSNGKLKVLN